MYTPRIEQDEDNVMNFMDTIKIFHDPFSCKITDKIWLLALKLQMKCRRVICLQKKKETKLIWNLTRVGH